MTGKYQLLNVGVIRACKTYVYEYHNWWKYQTEITKNRYLKKPGTQDFNNLVSAVWAKVTEDCVKRS